MTARFDGAIEAVAERFGASAAKLSIRRVDVDAQGTLHVTLDDAGGERWFRYDGDLVELSATNDERLPLCESTGRDQECPVLSYRPGRRVVIRGERDGRPAVLKGYRARRSSAAVRAHEAARLANRDAFRVPELIEHREESSCLVFEALSGEPVHATVAEADHFFAIGVLLRQMQQGEGNEQQALFSARDELLVLDRWAQRVGLVGVDVPEAWQRARIELDHLVNILPQVDPRPAHRDLHDKQLLATPQGIALLDFDLFCRADVALDPANMLAHLTLRSLQGRGGADEAGAKACGEALLEGLDRGGEATFWRRLRFYQATSFLRLSLIYRLRPRWSRLSPTLLTLGRRCLDELGSC